MESEGEESDEDSEGEESSRDQSDEESDESDDIRALADAHDAAELGSDDEYADRDGFARDESASDEYD